MLGIDLQRERVIDTLVLSYLYHPQMPGGHSVEAYGERFGIPKVQHNEWDRYTPAMLERCRQDTKIGLRIFLSLSRKMRERGFSEKSCWIEHEFADIIRRQQQNGFYFDTGAAKELYSKLRDNETEAGRVIHELFPRELHPVGEYRYRVTKAGVPHSVYLKHTLAYPKVELDTEAGPDGERYYRTFDWHEFNIGSPKQRVARLQSLGWEPEQFTKTGQPKTDEDSLKAYVKVLEAEGRLEAAPVQAIADWLVYNGRANMVGTWLGAVSGDHMMHGTVFSCGAGSRRCIHAKPNTANIPSNEAKYGHECRSLWVPRPGRRLLGYDAKSAQMRLFGHYLKNPDATRFYLGEFGDPHKVNGETAGIPRPKAKNCFYALIFGAQDPKLGKTAAPNGTRELGRLVRQALYKNTPGLEAAIRWATDQYEANSGWLPCVDGGWVRCPSPHAALNYLIQPAEAVLMKLTAIYLDREATRLGLDHLKVGDIHDEAQHDCLDQATAVRLGEVAVEVMPKAGEELGITVKMEADFKTGASWADTH